MTASAPPAYEQLIDRVVTALQEGSVAVARRHLMKTRATVGEDHQLRGAIAALELVCDARVEEDDEQCNQRVRLLQSRTSTEPLPFADAVGCTLSDAGDRLDDARLLEIAEVWFGQLVSTGTAAITHANHGVVLERLGRTDDAIAAFLKAVEVDPEFHQARLRLAGVAAEAGDLECAAEAYRAYLKAHPDDAHEWISLAVVLCDMAQIHDAEQAYWRAAGLEPTNVSLHFNWLISAHRAGGFERARDALKKLRAIAPQDWRTRVAEAFVLDKSGNVPGAFQLSKKVFLDLIAERNEETAEAAIEYVAGRVSELALRLLDEMRNEIDTFVDDVFAEEIFTDETLALIRALARPDATDSVAYFVQVEALYRDHGEPFACFVNYRVFARDTDEAAAFARQFEERCGASEVRISQEDIEQLERCEDVVHAGVCWRSGRMIFPADEFGIDK